MRHLKAGRKLNRNATHRLALMRNLARALFTHERITTTLAKAKALRPLADHLVTLAKADNLHARRQVLSMVPDTEVVKKLFDTIAARFGDRHGGYTRIIRAGTRPGDRALMVVLELVDRPEAPKEKAKTDAKSEKTPKAEKGEAAAPAAKGKKKKAAAEKAPDTGDDEPAAEAKADKKKKKEK